jgi:MYXO-CTERM domain-containing protein
MKMIRNIRIASLATALAAVFLSASPARAGMIDLTVTAPSTDLDPAPTGSWAEVYASSTLDTKLLFTATISNYGAETIYLSGISLLGSAELVMDDSYDYFYTNFYSVPASSSTGNDVLFWVNVPAGTSGGTYSWSVELTGMTESGSPISLDAAGGVNVHATPEPAGLSVAGMLLLGGAYWRRRRRR